MLVRLSSAIERLRSSLFVVPMTFIVGGLGLGVLGIELDRWVGDTRAQLPFALASTVESARSVLSVVATATITVAGIAFSVSLLVIQLASSQFSPRVVRGLLRDAFSKWVMGLVVGTFTYCLIVLRAVRSPLETGGAPVVPNISVAVAVFLGVASVLAIVAFIDHNAQAMDVSTILHDVTDEALSTVRHLWELADDDDPIPGDQDTADALPAPPAGHLVVAHRGDGWIQDIDLDGICAVVGAGGTVRLETEVGRYAVAGSPLCVLWPAPDDPDAASARTQDAVIVGRGRTVEQDVGYGIRQLADVALRALSPGVNDPTTAQDAMFHMGTVLAELLRRRPPAMQTAMDEHRTLLRPERPDHRTLIELGFDEVRLAAAGQPTVCTYLLELLRLLDDIAAQEQAPPHAQEALRTQAAQIRTLADDGSLAAHDADRLRAAYDRRFPRAAATT